MSSATRSYIAQSRPIGPTDVDEIGLHGADALSSCLGPANWGNKSLQNKKTA